MPGKAPVFGEAEPYRRFLASDVLPLVARRYRADMSRSVFVGHSFGALLGAHILLSSPDMFSHYVLSSPSLWYDRPVMFSREKSYADTHRDLKASVFLSIGEHEPAYMVRDLQKFDAELRSHRYPNLHTRLQVLKGHDHLTVFPDMITAALKWAIPGSPVR